MKFPDDFIGKIIQGDCLEVMRQMPDKCVDLVLTDPPYGINFEYESYEDSEKNLCEIIIPRIKEAVRIAKLTIVFCSHVHIQKFPQVDWVMNYNWNTTSAFGKMGNCMWQPILVYGKDLPGFGSINGVLKCDTFSFSGGEASEKNKHIEHPCPKPIKLMEKMVARLSMQEQIILDPFLVSGTTAVAAERLGRRWIGIEMEPKYCAIAQARVDAERNQLKLPGMI